jgi:hypothetical protein
MPGVPFAMVNVQGEEEFGRLAAALTEAAGGKLQRRAREQLRVASRPTLAQLKVAAMAVQVYSPKGGHVPPDYSRALRARIANATGTRTTLRGVRFIVDAAKVGEDNPVHGITLPRYLDATLPGYIRWRHPVFGRDDIPWQQQRGQPWFFATINRHERRYRDAVGRAVDRVLNEL